QPSTLNKDRPRPGETEGRLRMNRPHWMIAILLLGSPTAGFAQRFNRDDFFRTLPKAAERGPHTQANLDASIDFGFYKEAGWRAIGKGYFDTAEHEFISAIKAAKRLVPVDDRLVANGFADYAWALQLQKRYAEAEPHLKWVLAT